MKRERRKIEEISKSSIERVLKVGYAFDDLNNFEERYNALVMILTGMLIEEIKDDRYENFLEDLTTDVLDNVKEVKRRIDAGEHPFEFPPTEGNA